MTEQQLLKLTGDELSRVAGEVLQIKSNCYNCSHLKNRDICKATLPERNRDGCNAYKSDPIPLTWQEAMKQRDWAVEKFGVDEYVRAFKLIGPDGYAIINSQPYHYILAAVLCEIRSKGDN